MDVAAALAEAERLVAEYLPGRGWQVELGWARRQFGSCHHDRCCIRLSRPLIELNAESVVVDTIRHEIAHALAGPRAGHGPGWKRWARAVGAQPVARCGDDVVLVAPSVVGRCPTCGGEVPRHRRSANAYCRTCVTVTGRFDARTRLVWHAVSASG